MNAPASAAVYKTCGPDTTDQPQTNTHGTSTATAASRNTNKYSRMICHIVRRKVTFDLNAMR